MKNHLLHDIYWSPMRKPGAGWICFKDSPSSPTPVDPSIAAKAQGQANLESAVASSKLSNPNIITPYGSQTVTYGGGSGNTFDNNAYQSALTKYNTDLGAYNPNGTTTQGYWQPHPNSNQESAGEAPTWVPGTNTPSGLAPVKPNQSDFYLPGGDPYTPTVTQSLAPAQQQLLDQYNKINLSLGNVASQGLGYVQNQLDHPVDQGALPVNPVNAGKTYGDAAWSRLQPHIDQSNEQLGSQLANQGIMQGSDAYNNAQRQQSQSINDLMLQTASGSLNADQAARQNAIQEQAYFRNEPLNTLNAVRSSAQITNPQFQGFQGSQVAPAPIFQAAQAKAQGDIGLYNAQTAGANSQMQGLVGMGMTAATFY